ncbi:NAD(P)-dependent oxidoreductase [Neolewinella lacunae]|uniref:Hydroxyacid dehydrogenase n=1 Tax=Neolewinella lacunae TaxID=1517758 RepID=A0A923T9U1_9BACT|nr:NAD(P)-dependent oxidoreductase [Neolewinella lacunae]MBC6995428.1 hydroxyacid dehydrogenase [Neolewinella lacunae]MDN3633153.1 NAD(P)-dependent oxidoreductase [Neolewinella lacunae]
MNIAFIDQAAHPFLREALEAAGHTVADLSALPRAEVLTELKNYQGLMVRSRLNIDRELLDAAGPNFRFVARWGVGTDHIDLDYARSKGITVFNSPEGSKHTVAEHTVGMLLMLLNHLGRADRQVREGSWVRRGNVGTELGSLTVGLIGYGNMGQMTARRLQGFGCRVLAHDKFRQDYGDQFAAAASLEQIQAEADVVSLHLFLEGNHYYVNRDWIDAFAKPFYLINTARGLAVNTADLVAAMQSGKILGAALDVHEYEEQSFVHLEPDALPAPFQYLRQSDHTVLTPHIAGWSAEAEEGHARTLFAKICAGFKE